MTLNSISSAVNTSEVTLCFQLGNQQACTSNNRHDSIKEGLIFNPIFVDSSSWICSCTTTSIVEISSVEVGEHVKLT
jgi:hypothetical protein